MSKLPRITGKDAVKALLRAGFVHIRTRGSHYYLYHREKDRLVSVPVHAGKTLAPKTLKLILNQIGLTVEEFKNYLQPLEKLWWLVKQPKEKTDQ